MFLENIQSPKDLKNKSFSDLKILSEEIREMIMQVVSKKGGHLASSLGAVELCVALHYCLNTPDDSLIFDVGHQSYAHKILCGRKDRFHLLREFEGVSGFPNIHESPYDVFTTGHASAALSCAQGMAEAKKLLKDSSRTVAVIGDGSLTGGMSFEALNYAGHRQSEMLVIVNHNEMSISPSVGALSQYLTQLVAAPVYNRIKDELDRFLEYFSFTKLLSMKARKFEEALKGLMIPGLYFEELGFRYFGPIDGHDFNILIPTLKNVLSLKGPKILHVITKKGRGCLFSEENSEDYHSAVPFDRATGNPVKMPEDGFGDIFAKKLCALAETNDKIVAVTAAMLKGTGLNHFAEKNPKKIFDVGIAEEHAVAFAGGLCKAGLRPFIAVYSTFLQRAIDQIFHDVALQELPVSFVLDRAGVVGEDGPTHHGIFDIAYLRMIPEIVCMAPKDKEELEAMVEFMLTLSRPNTLRYPKGKVYSLGPTPEIRLGKAEVMREGKKVCLVAIGAMVKNALEASELLAKENTFCGLVNARFIKPLDTELLKKLASEYEVIITLEEAALAGGFGSAILELFEKEKLLQKTKLIRLGFPDEFIPMAKREMQMSMYGIDAEAIVKQVKSLFS